MTGVAIEGSVHLGFREGGEIVAGFKGVGSSLLLTIQNISMKQKQTPKVIGKKLHEALQQEEVAFVEIMCSFKSAVSLAQVCRALCMGLLVHPDTGVKTGVFALAVFQPCNRESTRFHQLHCPLPCKGILKD